MDIKTDFTGNPSPLTVEYMKTENGQVDRPYVWQILLSKLSKSHANDLLTGIFNILQQQIDFSDSAFISLLVDYINDFNTTDWQSLVSSFWNQSWGAALSNFVMTIYPKGVEAYEDSFEIYVSKNGEIVYPLGIRGGIPTTVGAALRIKDMKDADAGANFCLKSEIFEFVGYSKINELRKNSEIIQNIPENENETDYFEVYKIVKPWVIPWYNINGQTYSQVRDIDKIIGVLQDSEQLQFTQDSTHKWLRLIMPKNLRRVEIEDLNRNFWVIAQVVTGISAYLFDEAGGINKALKDVIEAAIDQWENVENLWAAIATIGQVPYISDIKTMVIPLNANELQPYLKYDNFTESVTETRNLVEKKLSYFKNSYLETNLIILPEVRLNNYEKNYYSKVYYPGIMVIDRNNDSAVKWFNLTENSSSFSISINGLNNGDKYYLLRQDEEKYYYFSPATKNKTDSNSFRYYALLRPDYSIKASYTDGDFNIITDIKYYDIIPELIGGTKVEVWNNGVWKTITLTSTNGEIEILKGFYQGELLSYYKISESN